MKPVFDFDGRVALVTGAGSGIGRAVATSLAQRGCALALADIDDAGMAETAALIGNRAPVSTHRLDVADRDAVAALPEAITSSHGRLDVLVNNAGVALGGSFRQISERDFDWLLSINFEGVVRMTRAFLPLLERSDQAQLVNVSSVFGLISPPEQTAYCASKFAVRGFTQSLREELIAAGSTVGVTLVCPGGVKTGIARNARSSAAVPEEQAARELAEFEKALRLSPVKAGEIIVDAIARRRARALVGGDAKIIALMERLMPVRNWRFLSRLM